MSKPWAPFTQLENTWFLPLHSCTRTQITRSDLSFLTPEGLNSSTLSLLGQTNERTAVGAAEHTPLSRSPGRAVPSPPRGAPSTARSPPPGPQPPRRGPSQDTAASLAGRARADKDEPRIASGQRGCSHTPPGRGRGDTDEPGRPRAAARSPGTAPAAPAGRSRPGAPGPWRRPARS